MLPLFSVPLLVASMVQFFSNLDHVGVILRNKKNEIFIFESSSGEGVGLTPWKSVIKFGWYESTDK